MTRAGWLVLFVTGAALAGIFVADAARRHHAVDTGNVSVAATTRAGIDLKSVVSLRQGPRDTFDVVATITVRNDSDQPVLYVGQPCFPPARPAFESTLLPPPGPPYPAPAAALRAHVMEHRRSYDQIMYFIADSKNGQVADLKPCDEMAPPMLPPKRALTYSMSQFIGTPGQPDVDAATTDVVTTLQLGSLPRTWSGRFPPPITVVDTIQVRTPLRTITGVSRPSMAGYDEASRHFDLLMNDARIAAWVDAQDPSLWRQARMTPDYGHPGGWNLEAFNHAWALPLVVSGTDHAITTVQIPDEPWQPPPSTDADLPPDSISTERTVVPNRDMYVGDLVLPSGKVMVGDSTWSETEVLFDYGLRPGSYPIHIVTAKTLYRSEEWEFVAWEELFLSSSPVTHWEPAIPVGHSAKELKPGETFVFGTDGGGGGFASPEAMKYMDAALTANADDPLLTPLAEREEANDWLWAMATVDPTTGANVFVTSTGGDGGFPILLGLDAENHPAALLSDFGQLGMRYSGF